MKPQSGLPIRARNNEMVRSCGVDAAASHGYVTWVGSGQVSFYLEWAPGNQMLAKCSEQIFAANFQERSPNEGEKMEHVATRLAEKVFPTHFIIKKPMSTA